jgi:hypothetical protein
MNAVKVDDARRVRLPTLCPGDYYEPEFHGEEEVVLRKVVPPRRKMTQAEALAAIRRSPLKFTKSWDEIKKETR